MAPEPILRAALRVLFLAGVETRNLTLAPNVPVKRINDLWEALHPVPDLLCRWRPDAERELLLYFECYDVVWGPCLRVAYDDALERA